MLHVDDALSQILEQAKKKIVTDVNTVAIADAIGHTLAEDQYSRINVPPADNSAMDGYAINTANLSAADKSPFNISQTITAGAIALPLIKNTAARIFTGAEIPKGANAVVMQEQCETVGDKSVLVPSATIEGNNIRRLGQDIKSGDCILSKGRVLQAQDCGLLASIGLTRIPVYRRLRVAILSTGNELLEPGQPLTQGKIYNSNRYLLIGLLKQLGWDIIDCGVVRDTLEATTQSLQQAATADCIISTGGVSVGEEDYVKQAVSELGELKLWRIALKPGKPLAFGHIQNTPFFGLPGNPVSTFLTFLLFVKPFLSVKQGETYRPPFSLRYKANFSLKANPKRQEYVRVCINQVGDTVEKFSNQSSGVLSSIVQSDAFAIIPINTAVNEGDMLDVIPFNHFLKRG